jgi:hypothetical protein
MPDQTIGELSLQGSAKLIFTVSEWQGRTFANVRKFVANQRYEGPTKSGLVLNKHLLREIIGLLGAIEKTLPTNTETEFGRIKKNDSDYIRLSTIPTEDSETLPSVDVREYVDSQKYQGPTKQGIRFRWNILPDVLACFREQLKVIGQRERDEPSLFGTGAFAEPEEELPTIVHTPHADSITELLGEAVKLFPEAFLSNASRECNLITLPDVPLRLDQSKCGSYYLKSEEGFFCNVRNPPEANFIIYSQLRGHRSIAIPLVMIDVFKCVKSYENYVRTVQMKLTAKVLKKVGQASIADYETRKMMSEAGLPWLDSE